MAGLKDGKLYMVIELNVDVQENPGLQAIRMNNLANYLVENLPVEVESINIMPVAANKLMSDMLVGKES